MTGSGSTPKVALLWLSLVIYQASVLPIANKLFLNTVWWEILRALLWPHPLPLSGGGGGQLSGIVQGNKATVGCRSPVSHLCCHTTTSHNNSMSSDNKLWLTQAPCEYWLEETFLHLFFLGMKYCCSSAITLSYTPVIRIFHPAVTFNCTT